MASSRVDQPKLMIKVLDTQEAVAFDLSNLPSADEILDVLAAEAAPLTVWFDFARAFLAQGNQDGFLAICDQGTKEETISEVERYFGHKPIYEQIQFNCGMAAISIARGREEKDKARKAEHFSAATMALNNSKRLNDQEQLVYLGYGLLAVAKNDLVTARQEFVRASQMRSNQRKNVAGLLALAAFMYNQKQYKEALQTYRRALSDHPGCPAEVRVGIGACQLKLGNIVSAQAAFERTIVLDPANADAHLGLAIIKLNSSNVQQGMADGIKLLTRAHELDPGHVGALNLLGHFNLLRGDYEKAIVLGRAALDACDGPASMDSIRADCHCTMARSYHGMGNINEAYRSYNMASRLDPNLPLPHLGLAQWWLGQGLQADAHGALINASSELESAIKSAPTFYDALKILGQLIYDNPGKVEKTLPSFRDAAARREDDADMWELLAELLAPRDPPGSLKAYQHVLDLHRKKESAVKVLREEHIASSRGAREKRKGKGSAEDRGMEDLFGSDDEDDGDAQEEGGLESEAEALFPNHVVPARLLNNAAVLLYRAGRVLEAISLMEEALRGSSGEAPSSASTSKYQRLTLSYNLARLREANGDYVAAKNGYQAILEQHESYIDCYLRLACIARRMGASSDAHAWATKALALQGGHADALALMSQLHLERRDYKQAHDTIKRLLESKPSSDPRVGGVATTSHKDSNNHRDSYGKLAYGNLNLALAPSDRKKPEDAERAKEKLLKALDQYNQVLKADHSNIYAANGLGAVLAELGKLQEAKDIFTEVQAAAASSNGLINIPDLYINLANVSLASQDYTDALRLYKVAMGKLDANKQSQVLLYLARGHYDSDDLKTAKMYLLRAIHIAPTDYKLRFNAALTMQEWAVRVYRKKRTLYDPTKVAEFRQAQDDLKQALKYFEQLVTKGRELTQLDPIKLGAHIKFCTEQMDKADILIQAAEEDDLDYAAKRQDAEQLRMLAEADRDLLRKKKEKEAAEVVSQREFRAKEAFERAERIKDGWRMGAINSEAAEGGAGNDGRKGKGGKRKRKSGPKDSRVQREAGSEEEEDGGDDGAEADDAEAKAAQVDALFGDDDDDDGDDEQMEIQQEVDSEGEGEQPAGGRLRKGGAEPDDEAGLAVLEDDPGSGAALEDHEAGGSQPTAKKARRAAIDSDEEEEGGRFPVAPDEEQKGDLETTR